MTSQSKSMWPFSTPSVVMTSSIVNSSPSEWYIRSPWSLSLEPVIWILSWVNETHISYAVWILSCSNLSSLNVKVYISDLTNLSQGQTFDLASKTLRIPQYGIVETYLVLELSDNGRWKTPPTPKLYSSRRQPSQKHVHNSTAKWELDSALFFRASDGYGESFTQRNPISVCVVQSFKSLNGHLTVLTSTDQLIKIGFILIIIK